MLTFRNEHISMIQKLRKTQTRRLWTETTAKRMMSSMKNGTWHQFKTNRFSKMVFAFGRIRGIFHQPLCQMTSQEIAAEGYPGMSPYEFLVERLAPINHIEDLENIILLWSEGRMKDGRLLYAVKFEILKEAAR